MATILLSAVGASLGAGFGGTVLGLSGAVIGRAVGASVGLALDQRLLGQGSRAVETGRVDRMRIQTAGEGTAVARLWGQMRIPGHVIWAAPMTEIRSQYGGGKGRGPKVTEISYRLSFALALCEGPIRGIGRVWADGEEISADDLGMRVYHGDAEQLPDPVIAAHEGEDAPAYRGIAYVVLEDLPLERWGNRVPQLSFEVLRLAKGGQGLARQVQAVALIPATGEYALATRPVTYDLGQGERRSVNQNLPAGVTDFRVSMRSLRRELPRVGSVSVVVSWFGDDLRAADCRIRPKVEDKSQEGHEMPWRSGGIGRAEAVEVARVDGRPIYGGTPADDSVIEALRSLKQAGQKAVFYPFIMMEQLAGNGLPDPWTGAGDQPVMPWRGRITSRIAAGRDGSAAGTAAINAEVSAFFGRASPGDFNRQNGRITYHGPDEWSYRRFILHYAHLCAEAGGVDGFLIGSEMIGLTQMRGVENDFPAVAELRRLAADVRAILGDQVKLSYAADWSEYFGYQPAGGDVYFHLDPLWADDNIDFIGIDNYMPLSDWRDGEDHLDAGWGRIHNADYLRANVAGGEGYDWYYASDKDRDEQRRTVIFDGAYGEDWVWRYKDIRNWWLSHHHERIDGVRQSEPTAWEPGTKPVWFTEMGCAALDKGTNQPNKFLDAMSSESMLPHYSDGRRDDLIQQAYIRAMVEFWGDPKNNPPRGEYGRTKAGLMVDMSRAHVWCWDARPYPAFPGRVDLWSDGPAWDRGHWLNGRAATVPLADVVAEICRQAGVRHIDTSALYGVVRGYTLQSARTGREALQPLMLAHGFDAVERDGTLCFLMRDGQVQADIGADLLAVTDDLHAPEIARASDPEIAGRLRVTHVEAGGDYAASTAEVMLPDDAFLTVAENELPMALTRTEGRALAERWLSESLVARDTIRLALPPSMDHLGPGDVIRVHEERAQPKRWRIDRLERAGAVLIDAVRVEPDVYLPALVQDSSPLIRRYAPPMPVWPVIMDLPLLRGDEPAHTPYIAATATPWPGQVSVWLSSDPAGGYALNGQLRLPSAMGETQTSLRAARAGVWDRGPALVVKMKGGTLQSAGPESLLAGANLLAIGDGSPEGWELLQFADARLVGRDLWELSMRLRGQAGTDAFMRQVWPAGSVAVLLDGAALMADLPPSARGQARHWRIGPATRDPEDGSFTQIETRLRGAGLRPLSPCHVTLRGQQLGWTRRTRIGGDGWDGPEVPLGEERETYSVRISVGTAIIAQAVVSQPHWSIPSGVWNQLRQSEGFAVEIAQLSDEFGPGPFVKRKFNV